MKDNIQPKELSMEQKESITDYRLNALEKKFENVETQLHSMNELLQKMNAKLSHIPEGGLQCQIHQVRMEEFERRMVEIKERVTTSESKLDKINSKILLSTGGFVVILWLLTNVISPYISQVSISNSPKSTETIRK